MDGKNDWFCFRQELGPSPFSAMPRGFMPAAPANASSVKSFGAKAQKVS